VNLSACNRKNLENLALAGAFDCFPEIRREQFLQPCGKNETFSDVLVRYGNKYQTDRMESRNSLFGDMGETVEIATPSIPEAPEWSSLDKLNKEKELVGIYISAHPLDEYRVILEDVCNVGMVHIDDKVPLLNKELTLGGVVTSVRDGRTKNGKPYGITRIEDFSGSGEIPLFGEPWLKWSNMMKVGNFLFIKARCVQNKYMPERVDLVINSIDLLQDVKDSVISSITLTMPLTEIDKEFVSDLDTLTGIEGKTTLKFVLTDLSAVDNKVSLASGARKITVTPELVDYIKRHESINLSFNQ
jgi:DNA polymerase-3 subunit alpha